MHYYPLIVRVEFHVKTLINKYLLNFIHKYAILFF